MRALEKRRSVAVPLVALAILTIVAVGTMAYFNAADPTRAAIYVSLTMAGVIALAILCLVPWQRWQVPLADQRDALAEFPPDLLKRREELYRATKTMGHISKMVVLPLNLIIGFTPVSSMAIGWMAAPFGGSQIAEVAVGVSALIVIGEIVAVPFEVRAHIISKRFGLTSQKWRPWTIDQVKDLAVSIVLNAIVLSIFYGAMWTWPDWWWLVGTGLLIAFVVCFGFLHPLVIAPIFNKYTPLPAGSLRDRLMELARRDGVKVRNILVADASRRTNTNNAAVMGFGATRKILIYDNLLTPSNQASPLGNERRPATEDEIACIVGHELSHAKFKDVHVLGFIALLQTCLIFCALFLLGNWGWLLEWIRADSITDGRALAVVFTIIGYWSLMFGPLNALVGRRIEAAGDWHALVLVNKPEAMESIWRLLVENSLANPAPKRLWYVLYWTHPSYVRRIAMARAFARSTERPKVMSATAP